MDGGSDASALTGWAGILTVPNLISIARLGCIPWFMWLLFGAEDRMWAALLLGGLGATDWVDGWAARRLGQVSELGKILDPTADRLLLLVAVPCLLVDGTIPGWFALTVLVREVLVGAATLALAALGARRIDVSWWGKTGTFALLWAVPCFLAGESRVPVDEAFTVMAWVFGLPGLAIAWWAAFGYLPVARRALAEGRADRA
ncbi:MAG: CDP-alcohol phosphatidyltransferase family protein [Acidimicrobiales bacterium]|nr:CDP-alcohol phosphatidyltransferase family protein [Acidimicrobiales bacterium]